MVKQAARVGDLHACPIAPLLAPAHVGGPITGPGAARVLVNGVPERPSRLPRPFGRGIVETSCSAGAPDYGLRFYGGNAREVGQFLTETFTPLTNRANLALPPQWNAMTAIRQWHVQPGTTVIRGRVGPQLREGAEYVGGAGQIFVLEPWKYGTLQ